MFKVSLAVLAAIAGGAAEAATFTIYTDAASFAAATATSHVADFESFTPGVQGQQIDDGGIHFLSLPGRGTNHDVYIASPELPLANTQGTTSQLLTADGDENFRISLVGGAAMRSIGFDMTTNRYSPHTLTLYGAGGGELGTVTITLPVLTSRFFGVVSDTPFAFADTTVAGGYIQDAGFDNFRIGEASPAPEPGEWAMLVAGLGVAGAAARRRKRTA